ncbi:hypothetical protein E2C01_019918 [Portunus trituberculatus]|uniref:Uncharacterized protein n=1 Tax=Portunus trituberculatus TaxID=210409 RepID=A0A5B7DYQ4_PORTR|nr:hypothetical protein [Portunus trituberculatus]
MYTAFKHTVTSGVAQSLASHHMQECAVTLVPDNGGNTLNDIAKTARPLYALFNNEIQARHVQSLKLSNDKSLKL